MLFVNHENLILQLHVWFSEDDSFKFGGYHFENPGTYCKLYTSPHTPHTPYKQTPHTHTCTHYIKSFVLKTTCIFTLVFALKKIDELKRYSIDLGLCSNKMVHFASLERVQIFTGCTLNDPWRFQISKNAPE